MNCDHTTCHQGRINCPDSDRGTEAVAAAHWPGALLLAAVMAVFALVTL